MGWSNNKILFFKGSYYVQYDITKDSSDTPKEIIHSFNGLWTSGIDAAVNWGNGKVYFFNKEYCVPYDIDKATPDFIYSDRQAITSQFNGFVQPKIR